MATVGTRRRRGAPAAWGGIALASLLLAGCDLFRPGTPEPPSDPGDVFVLADYSHPYRTLETLSAGLGTRGLGNGRDAYVGAFADSTTDRVPFYAQFDPEVARRYLSQRGRPVPTWNLPLERNFYSYLAGVGTGTDRYEMRWTLLEVDDLRNDEATLTRKYEVFTVPDTQWIAIGWAELEFKRISDARWAVVRWRDHLDPGAGLNPENPDMLSMSERRLRSLGQ